MQRKAMVMTKHDEITKLDYFAAKAMQAWIDTDWWKDGRELAARAFAVAEAMLAENGAF